MKSWRVCFAAGFLLGSAWLISQHRAGAQNGTTSSYQNEVNVEERDGYRYVTSNGIPDHPTGKFPSRGNPNRISPQRHSWRVTTNPQVTDKITPVSQGKFGFVLNGVPLDPGTAEWWNNDPNSGWHQCIHAGTDELGIDFSNAHVQPNGAYHYHGLPYGWLDKQPDADTPHMILTGYAGDGFPIYSLYGYKNAKDPKSVITDLRSSYRLKEGTRPNGPGGAYDGTYDEDYEYVAGSGDLDECSGRFGVTPEYPDGTYYYVLTEDYPYIPRGLRGTRDQSFRGPTGRPPGMGGRGGQGPQGGPPGGGFPGGPPPGGGPPPF